MHTAIGIALILAAILLVGGLLWGLSVCTQAQVDLWRDELDLKSGKPIGSSNAKLRTHASVASSGLNLTPEAQAIAAAYLARCDGKIDDNTFDRIWEEQRRKMGD